MDVVLMVVVSIVAFVAAGYALWFILWFSHRQKQMLLGLYSRGDVGHMSATELTQSMAKDGPKISCFGALLIRAHNEERGRIDSVQCDHDDGSVTLIYSLTESGIEFVRSAYKNDISALTGMS